MDSKSKELCQSYILARRRNPAWRLLAARRAPLVLSCLKQLFETQQDGIIYEDAVQLLAQILELNINYDQFDIKTDDLPAFADKELREWISRDLLIQRKGRLLATDALEKALLFMDSLDDRMMTSTASRLATVQREIENLEARLNPDRQSRATHIKNRIHSLQQELKKVEAGQFEVLEGSQAVEGIQEIYSLAMSLRSDFRRVEDSYRIADKTLRQSISKARNNRGEIVDKLLDGHESLLETPEGKVFHGFYEQLNQSEELDLMKQRLKTILNNPAAGKALAPKQRADLRLLVTRLVGESLNIIRARAISEKDVKNYLKTSIASDNHRVGELLNEIFDIASNENLDWEKTAFRRSPSPLPPVAVAVANLPLVERFRFKSINMHDPEDLRLDKQQVHLDEIEDEFWEAFDELDRDELIQDTINLLNASGKKLSIGDLADELLSDHDLETLAVWISMAREAGLPNLEGRESIDYKTNDGQMFRFNVPKIELTGDKLKSIDTENL